MTSLPALYQLEAQFDQLQELVDSGDLDPQTLADTLEGLEGTLEEKRLAVGAYIGNLLAEAAMVKEAERRMAERRKTAETRAQWLKDYLLQSMEKHGITEITCPEWRLRIRENPPAVEIDDGANTPIEYCETIPEQYRPDKRAIKNAILAGVQIDGHRVVRRKRLEFK